MVLLIVVMSWIILGILTYLLCKKVDRMYSPVLKWTVGDRAFGLFCATLCPITFLIFLGLYLGQSIENSNIIDWNKPAKW